MTPENSNIPSRQPIPMARAMEVFVKGFAFTRSFTHPYLPEQIGPLWVMRDAPRTRGNYRTEEWVAHDASAPEIDRIARQNTQGRYTVCVMVGSDESQETIRADFRALDYRLMGTESFMVHSLTEIPSFEWPGRIERVMTPAMANRLAKAARSRQILPQHFVVDAPLRQYVALIDDELVGWVRSIVVGDATWCSNMYVRPEFRRRGIARALLCQMLRDDRTHGAQNAVLLASHTGAKLYPVVGYEEIGVLLILTPMAR